MESTHNEDQARPLFDPSEFSAGKRVPSIVTSHESKDIDGDLYDYILDSVFPQDPEKARKKPKKSSWFDRVMAPMNPGSVRGSTIVLMSSMMGVGELALPFAMKQAGIIVGVCFIIIGGCYANWSFGCLTKVSFKRGIYKYSDLVLDVLGKKWNYFFQCIFLFYIYGTMLNFQIIGAHFFEWVLRNVFEVSDEIMESSWERPVQILAVNVLLYWIARLRSLYALRHATIVSVCVILYVMMVVIGESPLYISQNFDINKVEWAVFSPNLLSSYVVAAYAFNAQFALCPIKSELARPAEYRLKKIVIRAITGCGIVYATIASLGYLSVLDETPQVIPDREQIGNSDYLMTIGKCCLTMNLMVGIAVRMPATRTQLHTTFGKPTTAFWNEFFTAITLFSTAGIAILFPHIYDAITVVGGLGGIAIAYFFPGILYLGTMESFKNFRAIKTIILTTFGTLLGLAATTMTILKLAGVIEGGGGGEASPNL